jgi:hypothetical protein
MRTGCRPRRRGVQVLRGEVDADPDIREAAGPGFSDPGSCRAHVEYRDSVVVRSRRESPRPHAAQRGSGGWKARSVLARVSLARRHVVVVLSLGAALSACSLRNARVPWDTKQMAREIAADLLRFEHFDAEFRQVEVLGWHTVDSPPKQPAPPGIMWRRSHEALVWVRVENESGVPSWVVVDA